MIIQKFYNIPLEMRQYKSFVLWRLEDIGAKKPTKIPYQLNGELANVTDPTTWASFEECLSALQAPPSNIIPYSGIGFVFSIYDPFAFIDLDDPSSDPAITERQLKVAKEFDSYSEISPSGKGLHIITRGSIPRGRRRSSIEIYSCDRYATMTGEVYNNKPIFDYQDKLKMLYEQMGNGPAEFIYTENTPQKVEDSEIIKLAARAVNGEKFSKLLNGHWQDLYTSQSEADLAFIDILAFYTQNKDQIIRIFRQSPLGARKKAKRNDYVERMINRSFDHMLPLIDIDGFKIQNEFQGSVAQRLVPAAHNGSDVGSSPAATTIKAGDIASSNLAPATNLFISEREFKLNPPPGLVGEMARFIYEASPRQVPEIAIAAAIGLMGGICGKAYNVSGTGLNQYVILVANTGAGKESMASGIDKLMNAVRLTVPTAHGFLGPAEIASGQALVKYINTHSCFVSVLGEFGIRLQSISSQNANTHEKMLLRIMLDLYNKSGHHQTFRPSIYSDKEKNVTATQAPAFSILAESTPETFYQVLNEEMVSAGLLPRFLIIEYKGKVPYLNENAINVEPPLFLQDQFSSLVAQCETIMHAKKVINVASDDSADKLLRTFQKFATDRVNANDKDFVRQLWNRAHIKALKLSALIAVGCNYFDPIITTKYVEWSIELVVNDIKVLSSKFEQGEVGNATSELKQLQFARRIIREYLTIEWENAEKYKADRKMFDDKIVQGAYLSRRLAGQNIFRMDRMGSTIAIKRSLQALMDCDAIREVPPSQLQEKYGTRQKAYVIANQKMLGD